MTYYTDQKKCFQWLDKIVVSLDDNTINYPTLLIQAQNLFPVSRKALEKRIQLYIDAGMIEKKDNLLKKPKIN